MKDPENYSKIISSITSAYSLKSSLISIIPKEIKFNKLSPNLLYKSIKISNDDYLYFDNLSLNQASKIPDKLLYPHSMNDDIFSLLPSNSLIESLSASAQFFLSNYNESSKIFSAYEHEIFNQETTATSSPQFSFGNSSSLVDLSVTSMNNNAHILLNRLMEISNDIVCKEGTFHVFERFNHEDQLIPCLENALNSIFISAPDNAMNEISIATMYNILYFKHHKNPSLYEYQKMISVDKFKQQNGGMNPTGNFFSDVVKPNSTITSIYMKESAEVKWLGFCFSLNS